MTSRPADTFTRIFTIVTVALFAAVMGHTITKAMANVAAYQIEREAQ